MDRHYVPLRSAAPGSDYGDQTLGLSKPLEKRRRVGVSVACNSCRQRKTRCDGIRPACSNCLSQNIPCLYRDNVELSPEVKKIVIETIGMLSSLPEAELSTLLASLKSENNASVILSVLRDKTGAEDSPKDTTGGARDTTSSFGFETQNPTAYPLIPLPRTFEQPYPELTPFSQNGLPDTQMSGISPRQPSFETNKQTESSSTQAALPELCDPRLENLDIRLWTTVPTTNTTAARCISLYLETDHPLLGHFDPELFVSDLVSGRKEYCSSLLVNALLYWACQMYGYFDPRTEELVEDFGVEAERLWAMERTSATDSITNLAAAEFICLGYLGQGKDHALIEYVAQASAMGTRLGLFGVSEDDDAIQETSTSQGPGKAERARMFAAWGVFNWITLMSLFYRQPGIFCPRHPPRMAIPECRTPSEYRPDMPRPPSINYMGSTFPHICRFWCIVHEVSLAYESDTMQPWGSKSSLAFAEFKFRELLAWSNNLPPSHSQGRDHPHQVVILHLWFHAIILDIFRPFIQVPTQQRLPLRTFAGITVTANDVCTASIAQLKHLITEYRLHYKSSNYTILWQTALIYAINAILNDADSLTWYTDLLTCIYAYESLARSWRVVGGISKGLLSLAMRKSDLSSRAAVRILDDLRPGGLQEISGEIRATFIADLTLALTDHKAASMEHLAGQFEDNVWIKDYTTILDDKDKN